MRFFTRQLCSRTRSRRRESFMLIIGILLCLICMLWIINHNRELRAAKSRPVRKIYRNIPITNNVTISIPLTGPSQGVVSWPIDEQGRSLKTNFLVLDWTGFFGLAAGENERVECPSSNSSFTWTRQQNRIGEVDFIIAHDAMAGGVIPFGSLKLDKDKQQYAMAFVIESEVHSSSGDSWAKFHFKMTYNLDDSYPEPATYFDMNPFIVDLLKRPMVSYENKEKEADVVWIISNCHAQNGREIFVQQLMQHIKVHSYGACLGNRQGYGARMKDNVDAYKNYKFVIAIENSNCQDYVSEKLILAVSSGSVPIVAGTDGRPDYRRYMPHHSYINVFDYSSVKELADDLKRIANNKTLYESYLWYKNHDKKISAINKMPLNEKLKHLADVIGSNATMLTDGIGKKEKSENKVCKLIRFVRQTPWQEIAEHKRTGRADPSKACLPGQSISRHFESPGTKLSNNSNQR